MKGESLGGRSSTVVRRAPQPQTCARPRASPMSEVPEEQQQTATGASGSEAPSAEMTACEVKRPFKRDGVNKTYEWTRVEVGALGSLATKGGLRCLHCHGAVKLPKPKKSQPVPDAVVHEEAADAVNCRGGGALFKGEHRRS